MNLSTVRTEGNGRGQKAQAEENAANSSLARTALLNGAAQGVDQVAQAILALVLTPVLLRHLGIDQYGVWQMMLSSLGYLSTSDLRPMATLKYVMAARQHEVDSHSKQRLIGAALRVWMLSLPIFTLVGVLLVAYSNALFPANEGRQRAVTAALVLLVAKVALDRVLSLPFSILRAQNLEYRGMGLNALSTLAGGVLIYFALTRGFGLPGLAGAFLGGALLSSGLRLIVAKQSIPWLRQQPPSKAELRHFLAVSGWLTLVGFAELVLVRGDILLAGWSLAPTMVAVYVASGSLMRLLTRPVESMVYGSGPGMARIVGSGEWEKVSRARRRMQELALLWMAVMLAPAVVVNGGFVELWVGAGLFGGPILTGLIALTCALGFLTKIETTILDGQLAFRKRFLVSLLPGVLLVLATISTAPALGLIGVGLASFLSNVWLLLRSRRSVDRLMKAAGGCREAPQFPTRATALLTAWISLGVLVGWLLNGHRGDLFAAGLGISALSSVVMYRLGMGEGARSDVRVLATSVLTRLLPWNVRGPA